MKKTLLLCILFIIFASQAKAQSLNIIDIYENGSAFWTIEKHYPITTQRELNEWKTAIEKGQKLYRYEKEIQEVGDRINSSILSAQNQTNRSMSIINYEISYVITETISETIGVIRFSFEWTNFCQKNALEILVGDSFSGMMFSSKDVLIIQIPKGYEVESMSPESDKYNGNRIIWDGTMYHEFKPGEPAIILTPTRHKPVIWYFGIALLIIILTISILFWGKRYISKRDTANTYTSSSDSENDISDDIILSQHNDYPLRYLEDEDIIKQILLKYNGQAYQSDIVRESGLSKSKISNVLNDMKNQGVIIKIRKGRGNIIRLVKEPLNNTINK